MAGRSPATSPDDSGVEEGWIRLAIQISDRKPGLYTVETAVTLFGPDSQTGSSPRTRTADRGSTRGSSPQDLLQRLRGRRCGCLDDREGEWEKASGP
jgi:hypothetical protein